MAINNRVFMGAHLLLFDGKSIHHEAHDATALQSDKKLKSSETA